MPVTFSVSDRTPTMLPSFRAINHDLLGKLHEKMVFLFDRYTYYLFFGKYHITFVEKIKDDLPRKQLTEKCCFLYYRRPKNLIVIFKEK